eukprot:4616639-Amphidinium_carterae.1
MHSMDAHGLESASGSRAARISAGTRSTSCTVSQCDAKMLDMTQLVTASPLAPPKNHAAMPQEKEMNATINTCGRSCAKTCVTTPGCHSN